MRLPRFLPTEPGRLLMLWLLGRSVISVFVVGLPFLPSLGAYHDDVELYLVWAHDIAQGRFPFDDRMWQYPPLAGLIFFFAHVISPESISGFLMLALGADAAIAMLLVKGRSIDGLRLWVLAPALIGPVMLGRFDVFPALAVVAALTALANRPRMMATLISLGALMKVWPVLLLVALRRPLRPALAVLGIAVAVTAVALPITGGAFSFIKHQQERGIQIESIWAVPYLVAKTFGADVETPYQFGAREISALGTNFFSTLSSLITLLAIATIAVMRWSGRLDHLGTADVALVAVVASVAFSRVISPQYAVWILALAAVTLAIGETKMQSVIALLMWWSFLGFALYPFLYDGLREGFIISVLVQVVRTWLLLRACYEGIQIMRSGSTPASIDLSRPEGVSQVQFSSTHDRPA